MEGLKYLRDLHTIQGFNLYFASQVTIKLIIEEIKPHKPCVPGDILTKFKFESGRKTSKIFLIVSNRRG